MRVHTSKYAGDWYPADPCDLRDLIGRLFAESETRIGPALLGGARGFIVPHAGLVYSGTVAAAAYRHLARQNPRTVVLLGFMHRFVHQGVALATPGAYCTPMGEILVDLEAIKQLQSDSIFHTGEPTSLTDHSVEIQLPLLQSVCPETRVVPAYVGEMTDAERVRAAKALAALSARGTVIIASSDLTHYGRDFGYVPFPAGSHLWQHLRRLDAETMEAAGSLHPDIFLREIHATGSTVCGRAPIALLLETMRGEGDSEIYQQSLDYRTSSELTGDTEHSVSYGAAGYFPAESFSLSKGESNDLIESAGRTLLHYSRTGERRPVQTRSGGALCRRQNAFVSIHRNGRLQGCVGRITCEEGLREAIPQLTLAAALDDPRFGPMRRNECAEAEIEISVLTPVRRVAELAEFRLGVHGALLEAGPCHALLLPQVGRQAGWTADRFFGVLSQKAGLADDGWQSADARISVFQAFSYSSGRACREALGEA